VFEYALTHTRLAPEKTVGDKGGEGEVLIKLRNLMVHQKKASESEKYLNQIKMLQRETGMRFLPKVE
jgi:hypothetical protein